MCHRLNDFFVRPGEQSIPTGEMGKSPLKRRRNQAINELQNLKYLPRSSVEREVVFEDRTPAHAGKQILSNSYYHEIRVEHLNGQPVKFVLLFSGLQLLVAGRV